MRPALLFLAALSPAVLEVPVEPAPPLKMAPSLKGNIDVTSAPR